MKKLLNLLAILATVGVWVADFLLLDVKAFRNGWWTVALFAVPLGLLAAGWGGEGSRKLPAASWIFFILGCGGYVAMRTTLGNIRGEPIAVVGGEAPDFMLKNQDGKDVRLSELGGGKLVLVFFRGSG